MTTHEQTGRVCVSIETSAPAETAFAALVQPDKLASWFGAPTTPLREGGATRIEFGDGDFFSVEGISIEPPERLRYAWRFLGLGSENLITWTVIPRGARTLVTVTDEQPERGDREVAKMSEGWRDFLDRLSRHLTTGEPTRYDWRRDIDGDAPLGASVESAAAHLFSPEGLDHWQPWRATSWRTGARLALIDGEQPSALSLTELERGPTDLRLVVTATGWQQATCCHLALVPQGAGSLLTFSHVGWENIDARDEVQRMQRKRFCGLWVGSLTRARAHAGAI